jgi:hypothetical protein
MLLNILWIIKVAKSKHNVHSDMERYAQILVLSITNIVNRFAIKLNLNFDF